MKKNIYLAAVCVLLCCTGFCQSWGNWIEVGKGIEVSFRFSSYGCNGYTYARLRNTSSVTYSEVRVTFMVICADGSHEASVSAYKIGAGEIDERKGNWYNTDERVNNIRLDKADVGRENVSMNDRRQTKIDFSQYALCRKR